MTSTSRLGAARRAALLPLLLLAACGHSAPTRLFTLQAVAPPAASSAVHAGRPVRIAAVRVPAAIDRTELLSPVAPGELKIEDLDHWAAPLGRLARQTLTEDLAARLPAGAVIFADGPAAGSDAVSVTILSLEFRNGEAVMQVGWTYAVPGLSDPHQSSAVLRRAMAAPGAPGIVRALSDLLGDLADRLALDVHAHAGGRAG